VPYKKQRGREDKIDGTVGDSFDKDMVEEVVKYPVSIKKDCLAYRQSFSLNKSL
jgi:hypothetical protein